MNISIRQSVITNLHKSGYDGIENTIKDAIQKEEEKTLPGLGVLFELLWQASDDEEKSSIINSINNQLTAQ